LQYLAEKQVPHKQRRCSQDTKGLAGGAQSFFARGTSKYN